MQEMWLLSLGGENPQEEGMATHSSVLAWKSHRQRGLVGYSTRGCKELDTTWQLLAHKETPKGWTFTDLQRCFLNLRTVGPGWAHTLQGPVIRAVPELSRICALGPVLTADPTYPRLLTR